jgi:putative transposase
VTTRGVRRSPIFHGDDDRTLFLQLVDVTVRRHGWSCFAFCLMTTHFHLLIETPGPDLGEGMQRLNSVYAQAFNDRHGCTGHVFEQRYHSVLVETDGHLLHLFRYLALNPVAGGLVSRPATWRWSSYPAALGLTPRPPFLAVDRLLRLFDERHTDTARHRLRAFVEDAPVGPRPGSDPVKKL